MFIGNFIILILLFFNSTHFFSNEHIFIKWVMCWPVGNCSNPNYINYYMVVCGASVDFHNEFELS